MIGSKRKTSVEAELALAEKYLAGDRRTYNQVNNWIKQVSGLSIWHLIEDSEDVNSVVHLKLITNLRTGKFRGESTFRTYVQRIARYTCIDQVRSQRVVRDVERDDLPLPSTADSPVTAYEKQVEHKIFLKIFRSIGTECQQLWRMIFSESLNYKEIGKYLNLPEGTVKRKVHQCKKEAIELKERLL